MDLDQWISKVKEGQHLLEDELQLLCEYVRVVCSFYSLYRIRVLLAFEMIYLSLKFIVVQLQIVFSSNFTFSAFDNIISMVIFMVRMGSFCWQLGLCIFI